MSLPPELRVLCFQLSSTPTSDLPRHTSTFLRHVSRCQAALSSPAGNSSKAEDSASSVQVHVHKLKTQITALLNGKSSEGRFVAVVLVKAVVEVGGWEILRSSESWVRGLLSVLGKSDSPVTRELCIITLTKIYCMTHPYQTLVREITTPTLPAFVTSCLGLISSKPSKGQEVPGSTVEDVFRSFATLLPRHTTLFRPFVAQIRAAARPYVATTISDGTFVSSSLAESARQLIVLSHQTVAKSAGGEEWGKAVHNLLKDIHVTADRVFRAVVEDWESAAGYKGETVDVNAELSGGAKSPEDLPRWIGIGAGIERVNGLLQLLTEYLRTKTSLPVSIPLGAIGDMVTRVLSVAIPSPSQSVNGQGSVRLHPAIDRDERDGLWSGMPQIYVAALQVVFTMADMLEGSFIPMAQGFLDQLAWVYPYGRHDRDFRRQAYWVAVQLLPHTGPALGKATISRLSSVIKSCCQDLIPVTANFSSTVTEVDASKRKNGSISNTNQNADLFLQSSTDISHEIVNNETDLLVAARELLPLLISQIPQQYLDISLRSLVERTAIISHNKEAMLAAILFPFVGKTGKPMTSILPHLTREFSSDQMVEVLLRPRMPLLPSTGGEIINEEGTNLADENEEMEIDQDFAEAHVNAVEISRAVHEDVSSVKDAPMHRLGLGGASLDPDNVETLDRSSTVQPSGHYEQEKPSLRPDIEMPGCLSLDAGSSDIRATLQHSHEVDDSDSDEESVHLTMDLDTDSDSEG